MNENKPINTDLYAEISGRVLKPHYSRTEDQAKLTDQAALQNGFLEMGYTLNDRNRVDGATYISSLDLQYHDQKSRDEAWRKAKLNAELNNIKENSAAFFESFLRNLLAEPRLKLVHLATYTALGTGFAQYVYGYTLDNEGVEPNQKTE